MALSVAEIQDLLNRLTLHLATAVNGTEIPGEPINLQTAVDHAIAAMQPPCDAALGVALLDHLTDVSHPIVRLSYNQRLPSSVMDTGFFVVELSMLDLGGEFVLLLETKSDGDLDEHTVIDACPRARSRTFVDHAREHAKHLTVARQASSPTDAATQTRLADAISDETAPSRQTLVSIAQQISREVGPTHPTSSSPPRSALSAPEKRQALAAYYRTRSTHRFFVLSDTPELLENPLGAIRGGRGWMRMRSSDHPANSGGLTKPWFGTSHLVVLDSTWYPGEARNWADMTGQAVAEIRLSAPEYEALIASIESDLTADLTTKGTRQRPKRPRS